jgi:hypothetical protein
MTKWILIAALVAAQFADIATTEAFLRHGFAEGNPFQLALMGALGSQWWIGKLLCVLPAIAIVANGRLRYAVVLSGWYGIVLLNNIVLLAVGSSIL